ncbi:Hypothetical protein, putative [Bodo saltans]|uniref:Phosphatidylinositol-4-phosphate 5-kinase n=1 Tax=Bodo saltans TaxID=75058 RepID=A0A0S4J443_BODSA|nr:Hypothetical protein, putative [Bodo saltans]|eukprot:CUG86032.1 Hypothetical protein, putative [Bodo saltans]
MSSTSRFVVNELPMYDSNTGKEGGIRMIYTGDARRHPWPSREGEFVADGEGVARLVDGSVYTGDSQLGMFHGNGKMEYPNGDLYEGQWANNTRHGYGVFELSDGSSYIGAFRHGDKDGAGEELYVDGTVFAGMYRNGLRHGVGRIRVKSSGDVVDGVYVDGKLEGLVTVTYGHGDMFIGKFRNGVPHGEGVYTQIDSGDTYTETFQRGQCVLGVLEPSEDPVGELGKYSSGLEAWERPDWGDNGVMASPRKVCTVQYKATNDSYVGEWKREASGSNRRGVRQGRGRLMYHATGEVYEGEFENNMREGYGELWYPAPPGSNIKKRHSTTENVSSSTTPEPTTDDSPQQDVLVVPDDAAAAQAKEERYPVVYRGAFHLDLQDGEASIEYSDGTITQQFFSKGLPHGLCHELTPMMDYSDEKFVPSVRSLLYDHGSSRPCDYGQSS